jgi:hypothetical protein
MESLDDTQRLEPSPLRDERGSRANVAAKVKKQISSS